MCTAEVHIRFVDIEGKHYAFSYRYREYYYSGGFI